MAIDFIVLKADLAFYFIYKNHWKIFDILLI